jgi:hypothetical protein
VWAGGLAALGLLGCISVLSQGCSNASSPSSGGEESLRRAVERYWDSRLARDYGRIYDESLSREARTMSRDDFIRSKGNVRYHWYNVEEIVVEGDNGTTRVRYAWNHEIPEDARPDIRKLADREPFEEALVDEWILEDQEWRLMPRPLMASPSRN